VSLLAAPSVTDNAVAITNRTAARQLRQADLGYPGSALSSVDGSAIKRITAGVKARRWSYCQSSSRRPAFTLLHGPVSNEKRTSAPDQDAFPLLRSIGRFKTVAQGESTSFEFLTAYSSNMMPGSHFYKTDDGSCG
jgi:hypothetical protein